MMRRILSSEEMEKKKKRNKTILSLLMLGIMILSTAGFAFIYTPEDNSQQIPPEGLVDVGGQWAAVVNEQAFYFSSSPDVTSSVQVDTQVTLSNYAGKNLFVDSTSQEVTTEILSTLGRFASRAQEACYGACERDLPEKDCTENLIIWKESAERKIYQQDNCVFIEGDLTAVDAFLYKVFGFQ